MVRTGSEGYRSTGRRGAAVWAPVVAVVALALSGCARARPGPTAVTRETPPRGGRLIQEGLASYYHPSLAGNKTASGERYDPRKPTAAHRTLPLGTTVVVTRIDRGGRVVAGPVTVRVNDRGPYSGRRIIDLSHEVARRLGMLRDGVVRVRIEAPR